HAEAGRLRGSVVGGGCDRGELRHAAARVQFRSVRHRNRAPVLVPRGLPARRDGEPAPAIVNRWLIVAGDFTPLGGMDAANHALARYLAGRGDEIELVTHRAWPDLAAMPTVAVRRVARPLGKPALGKALRSGAGRRAWRRLQPLGARAVVNGGNCGLAAINWVHYVHAAYEPSIAGSLARRSRTRVTHHRDVAAERRALLSARLVVCNSARTMR